MESNPGRYVVTGAAGGIGGAVARALLARGDAVACVDLDADRVAEVAAQSPRGLALTCDVTQESEVQATFDEAWVRLGGLDGMVHSAGGSRGEAVSFLQLSFDVWRAMVDRNLTGSFLCGSEAARLLAPNGGGSIVFISSQLSRVVRPGLAHYAAAKGGVEQLARGMALDLVPAGIRVNAVAPGPVMTPGNEAWFQRPDVIEEHARTIPMGRVGQPEDVVGAVLYLLDPASKYTTGASILVDGGYTII